MTDQRHRTVYGIVQSKDRLLVYVGQTAKTLEDRLLWHYRSCEFESSHYCRWLEWLRNNSEPLDIIELAAGNWTQQEARDIEREQVETLTLAGVELKNTLLKPKAISRGCTRRELESAINLLN